MARIRIVLSVLLLAFGLLGVSAPAAASTTALQNCVGTESVSYQPGLNFTPRQVQLVADVALALCTDLARPSGTLHAEGEGTLSCANGSSAGTAAINWVGGAVSKFDWTGLVAARPSGETVLVITGQVTQGPYTGQMVVWELVLFTLTPTQCFTEGGLTSASGPIVLQIV